MQKKRNSFLTVVFSFLPGAGHMFMGFMKTGISLMSAFFLIIFLSSWLSIGPLIYILPVLWFFSFFDCINRLSLSDEDFNQLPDQYLFFKGKYLNAVFTDKGRLIAGAALVLFGAYLLTRNVFQYLTNFLPDAFSQAIDMFLQIIPQTLVGVIIIAIGIKLIIGRKREDNEKI